MTCHCRVFEPGERKDADRAGMLSLSDQNFVKKLIPRGDVEPGTTGYYNVQRSDIINAPVFSVNSQAALSTISS